MSGIHRRFVGGEDCTSAIRTALDLHERGIRASLFYLGEYVTGAAMVARNVQEKIGVVEALADVGLDVHVSVDPTQIGYAIDDALGERNAITIGERVAAQRRTPASFLMLDMEDYSLVERTLALRRVLQSRAIPAAITLQAYLRRTECDIQNVIAEGAPAVRLVKGAFAEGGARAWIGQSDIQASYLRIAANMLSRNAKRSGFFPVFATHDDVLVCRLMETATNLGWEAGQYEFEMLYGVRPGLQARILDRGQQLRLYLPFGEAWWPYTARRIGENPRNLLLIVRAVAGRDSRLRTAPAPVPNGF